MLNESYELEEQEVEFAKAIREDDEENQRWSDLDEFSSSTERSLDSASSNFSTPMIEHEDEGNPTPPSPAGLGGGQLSSGCSEGDDERSSEEDFAREQLLADSEERNANKKADAEMKKAKRALAKYDKKKQDKKVMASEPAKMN